MTKEFERKKYLNDKRYHAGPDDTIQKYSLRNRFGFYFEYIKLLESIRIFNSIDYKFKDKKILDVGCNKGYQLHQFAFLKGTSEGLFGIDFIPSYIEMAKKINNKIKFEVMDAYNLKFNDGFFDLISLIYFMNCVPKNDRAEFAKGISKKVKKGGHILVFEFLDDPIINSIRKVNRFAKERKTEIKEYVNDKLLRLYFKDFKIVKSKKVINLFSPTLTNRLRLPYALVQSLDLILPKYYYIALLEKR